MKKRLLSFLLVVTMLASISSNFVFASDLAENTDSAIFSLISENSISAEIKFTPEQSGSADVIAAQYGSSEKLQSVEVLETIQVTANVVNEYNSKEIAVADNNTLKIFIWNSEKVLTPVLKTPAEVKVKPDNSVAKFVKADSIPEAYDYGTSVTVDGLVNVVNGSLLDTDNIQVSVVPVGDESTVIATYTANTDDWTKGIVAFDGIGKATVTVTDNYFCVPTSFDITINPPPSVDKFIAKENLDYIFETEGEAIIKTLGDIFTAVENADINNASVDVTVSDDAVCEYTKDETDWTKSTLKFIKAGKVSVSITDNNYCIPASAEITVSDKEYSDKFVASENLDFIFEGEVITKTLGDIFAAVDGAEINSAKVDVTVDGTICEYTKDEYDWSKSVVSFNGAGTVAITITDKNYCNNAVAVVTVTEKQPEDKFTVNENLDFAFETEGVAVTKALGDIFKALDNVEINSTTVTVTVSGDNICEYTNDSADWTKSTLTFTKAGTVTVTITDNNYCNEASATIIASEVYTDKFVAKFDNDAETTGVQTDFLYRVGNGNTVALSSLFETKENAVIGDVTVTVSALNGASVSGTYTKNATDWTKGTIQFAGTGPVKVVIDDNKYTNELELILEVVDANNVTAYSGLANKNSVLLNDIIMTSGSSYYLSGSTLYGNGFTFDMTDGTYAVGGNTSSSYVFGLHNSHLDNVKVVGAVYTQYGATVQSEYNRAAILSTGNNTIENSYISNCASAVRVKDGNLEIINSTVKGGNFANIDIRGGHVILDNVTTINQVNGNDVAKDGTVVVGLGIVIYYENVLNTTTLEIKNGLTQYNNISKSQYQTYLTDNYARTLVSKMFESNYASLQYNDGNDTWVNTGIISMIDTVGDANISDIDGYIGMDASITVLTQTANGYVYSKKPDASSITDYAPEYETLGQAAIAPSYSFDYTTKNYVAKTDSSNDYCYEAEGTVYISMDEGDNFSWDTSILTVTKNGATLGYSVSMNGIDYTGKSISFAEAGNYEVVYTYTDNSNCYVDENGNITTYARTYTKTVHISVAVIKQDAKTAEFTMGSTNAATEKITINNTTYISATGVTADNSKWTYMTINGQKVYYPIIAAKLTSTKGSSSYAYFPVFENAITITDYADGGTGDAFTYNASTKTLPSTLTAVKGIYKAASDVPYWYNLTDSQLTSSGASNIFKWASSSLAPADPTTYNNVLCYQSPQISASRAAYITLVQYSYTDSTNTTYHYYIGYTIAAYTYQGICVAPDTLVTMGDGSKKAVKDVTVGEEIVAWNFYTGNYEVVPAALAQVDGSGLLNVLHLYFEDGTELKVLGEHGIFDADLNNFIFIDEDDVTKYIGHSFVKKDGDSFKTVKLVDYKVTTEDTAAYTILSAAHHNVILEDMFTNTPAHVGGNFFNPFEIGEDMKYDADKVKSDIEKYGLYTYEDFSDVLTKEQFEILNIAPFKVAVGKGLVTYEGIIYLIKNFINR